MKMVTVIYRHSLDQDIQRLLKQFDLKTFTEAPKVVGIGEAAQAFGSLTWPGHHAIILSAMKDNQADRVVAVLKEFSGSHGSHARGSQDSPSSFVWPCQQVI